MTRIQDASNRLFQLAQRGERLTSLVAAVFVTLIIVGLSPIVEIPFVAVLQSIEAPSLLIEMVRLIVVFSLYVLLVTLWLKLHEKRPLWTIGLESQGALPQYLRGVLIAIIMYSSVVASLALLGYVHVDTSETLSVGIAALPGILAIFLAWTIQGGAEEILYRGWLFPTLTVRYHFLVGLTISGLLFMIAHGLSSGFSLLAAINLLLFASFAALYALREESLWGIAGWHTAWNWAQANLFGLPVSGYEIGDTLVNLKVTRPDWISGGNFGPEGGIVVSVVLLLGVASLVLASQKQSR